MTETLIDVRTTRKTLGETLVFIDRYVRLHPLQDVHLDGVRLAVVADEKVI